VISDPILTIAQPYSLSSSVRTLSDAARERLAKLGYDPQFGARPLKRVLQREILNELSKQILAGKIHKDSLIFVDLRNDTEFVFENIDQELKEAVA